MAADMLYKRLRAYPDGICVIDFPTGGFEEQSKGGSVRNAWLALAICVTSLIAAQKSRDWQTGLVVESKAHTDDPRVHAIAGADKTYYVKGSIGGDEDGLAVGATVRFVVQGTTMFLSIAGNEYRLSVLGATLRTAPRTPAASPPVTPAQKDSALPHPSAAADKPPATASEPLLDNDAVVKMIVGGLKEDTVVSVIQARPGKYALAPDALAALRAAGVSQRVITAMSAKMSAQH
jgi:hypothetical protein